MSHPQAVEMEPKGREQRTVCPDTVPLPSSLTAPKPLSSKLGRSVPTGGSKTFFIHFRDGSKVLHNFKNALQLHCPVQAAAAASSSAQKQDVHRHGLGVLCPASAAFCQT